jgi:hypothetical protein
VTRWALTVVAAAAVAATAVAPSAEARRAPVVRQMVVFRSGNAVAERVSTRGLLVWVRSRRRHCATATGTALSALVRSKPGRIRLRDFGSCSRRARDGAGLFVARIGPNRNSGRNGWVYKVGRKAATAGAADPSGPFGHGRLRSGQRVLWFYCFLRSAGCQRTLAVRTRTEPGAVMVRVVGYNDEGRGKTIAGATVKAGGTTALSDPNGLARLELAPGRYRLYARKDGLVRSFSKRVTVAG